jgi:hypothetical protein
LIGDPSWQGILISALHANFRAKFDPVHRTFFATEVMFTSPYIFINLFNGMLWIIAKVDPLAGKAIRSHLQQGFNHYTGISRSTAKSGPVL